MPADSATTPVNTRSMSLRPAACIALSLPASSGAGALVKRDLGRRGPDASPVRLDRALRQREIARDVDDVDRDRSLRRQRRCATQRRPRMREHGAQVATAEATLRIRDVSVRASFRQNVSVPTQPSLSRTRGNPAVLFTNVAWIPDLHGDDAIREPIAARCVRSWTDASLGLLRADLLIPDLERLDLRLRRQRLRVRELGEPAFVFGTAVFLDRILALLAAPSTASRSSPPGPDRNSPCRRCRPALPASAGYAIRSSTTAIFPAARPSGSPCSARR